MCDGARYIVCFYFARVTVEFILNAFINPLLLPGKLFIMFELSTYPSIHQVCFRQRSVSQIKQKKQRDTEEKIK